jgi:putative phosphoribosyl transferase
MAMAERAVVDSVVIPVHGGHIAADLARPQHSLGLVVFAHGSGSSRFSSRNRVVAEFLQRHRFATLLLDLLTHDEEAIDVRTAQYRFDIDLLAERVVGATDWVSHRDDLADLQVGYFGASTGAAAALIAAAARPASARAVVSRGGRPDLAGAALTRVEAPTLLIVGGDDAPVVEMNESAMRAMRALVTLEIVPEATHLFEEPGTLDRVMQLATDWFARYLGGTNLQDGVAPTEV